MAKLKWHLTQVNRSDVKRNPNNPKKRDDRGFERLRKSLDKFGCIYDGIVNKDLTLIDGHSRLEITEHETLNVFVPSRQLDEKELATIAAVYDAAQAGFTDFEIVEQTVDELDIEYFDLVGEDDIVMMDDIETSDSFELPDGDKAPFQQMTFTLADEQAEQIKNAIADIKQTEEYKYCETMGNENSNGNALYLIVMQWAEQRK